MSNSTLRRTTFFKLATIEDEGSVIKLLQPNNNSVGFPNLKRSGKPFSNDAIKETSQRYTRPRNQFVLMRTLLNRRVNLIILQHFNKTKLEKKMFTLTSKITSKLWNESSSDLRNYFSLLAALEENWHKNKHYCSWDRNSAQTLSMEPIELSQVRARLMLSLTLSVGSPVSSYTPKELSIIPKSKSNKRKYTALTPEVFSPATKFNYKIKKKPGTKSNSNLSKLRFKSKQPLTPPDENTNNSVFKKRYTSDNGIIEDLFLM
ncbi:unnamed protein product [Kluyveromyces dobzhanskii CBS 2104]|uniref:WGS project CCBQ000000000 data, contig MAT n=1 Tax=Kluyveromyces dobzhanskii CBS 2104 TaxID=1427455 RepID=A0A0A8L3I9_9SACH|nr:unnamed protein product [Kluyveromyces dobzhanskii CBS 2104]